jgi:hypothetical protein
VAAGERRASTLAQPGPVRIAKSRYAAPNLSNSMKTFDWSSFLAGVTGQGSLSSPIIGYCS